MRSQESVFRQTWLKARIRLSERFERDMRVDSTETERVDSRTHRLCGRPALAIHRRVQNATGLFKNGVWLFAVRGWWNYTAVHAAHCLDQTGDARSGFRMTNDRLYRS